MDRKQFIQQYGVRGHSTTFIVMVYAAVAFLLLNNSADVPDEWWQSLEVAYQQVYVDDVQHQRRNRELSAASESSGDFAIEEEFPDGVFSSKDAAVPKADDKSMKTLQNSTAFQFTNTLVSRPQSFPTLPKSAQLAYGVRPWEWQTPNSLRPFTYPMAFYGAFKGLKAVEDFVLADERKRERQNVKDSNPMVTASSTSSSSPLLSTIISIFVPTLVSHEDAIGWVRSLFYILPKLMCVLVAVLLHKTTCRFGRLVFEEILTLMPKVADAEDPKKPNAKANTSTNNTTTTSHPLSSLWNKDANALRAAIAPTTSEKYNKRVSIFVLTNFMLLYMSSRSLSNVPEALVFMWCLAIYADWRVASLRAIAEKRALLASIIGERFGDAVVAKEKGSQERDKSKKSDEFSIAGRSKPPSTLAGATDSKSLPSPPSTIATAIKLLFVGGFGCTMRTTMAVPFAGIFFSFVLDVMLTVRPFKSPSNDRSRNMGDGILKKLRMLISVKVISIAVAAFWLGVVLAIDSWYYCGTDALSVLRTLVTTPSVLQKDLFGAASEKASSCTFAFTPLNFYKFNFQQGHSSFFGSHPIWWYFALGAPACVGANLIFLVMWTLLKVTGRMSNTLSEHVALTKQRQELATKRSQTQTASTAASSLSSISSTASLSSPVLSMSLVSHSPLLHRLGHIVLSSLLVYSVLEHKEMRFVFPFITCPAMVASAVMYEEINNWASLMWQNSEIRKEITELETVASDAQAQSPTSTGAVAASKKVSKKTFVQRLALLCLVANLVGLIFIGKAFKVGPPAIAHYFRTNSFAAELYELKTSREVVAAHTTTNAPPREAALTAKNAYSHLPSLHIWAGCYAMPGPSYYHHVFRAIRAVSCNTMAVSNNDNNQKDTKSRFASDATIEDVVRAAKEDAEKNKGDTKVQRYPTEHELFLQFPELFLRHVYGKPLAKLQNRTNSPTLARKEQELQRQKRAEAELKRKNKKQLSTTDNDKDGSATAEGGFFTRLLKPLQSKAAQDTVAPTNPADAAEAGKLFAEKLGKALEGIRVAGQSMRITSSSSASSNDMSKVQPPPSHTSLYGGLLGWNGEERGEDEAEPLPDVIVMFSSLSAAVEASILTPLGYSMRRSFYHTFAVVDEGSGHFIEVWVRDE